MRIARCKAIGYVLELQLKSFIEECKANSRNQAPPAKDGEPANLASASVLSAAGDRAKLGQGPPCKNFADLRTFASLAKVEDDFLLCASRDDIQDVLDKTKSWKRAAVAIITLASSIAKDLKGAVAAAHKRVQQKGDIETKARKTAAAGSQDSNKVSVFETIPNLVRSGNAKIQQIIIARAGPDQEKNDYTKPFMVNISPDTEPWKDLVSAAQKLIGDFRLEFESAPVRATAGRGQKALEKLGPDPNLETKLNECCFSTHVLMADRAVCDTEEKKNIVGGMVVFGVCKELGDLCSREGIHGHRGNDHCWIC